MKYIDVFSLWSRAELNIKRPISIGEVVELSKVTQPTINRMRRGVYCDPAKLGAVAEALYKISGMKRPEKINLVWLEGEK